MNNLEGKERTQIRKMILAPQAILRYLIGDDEEMDTLIMCKSSEVSLVTSDYSIYEAMGSIKEDDDFKLNKLVKFFEVVEIQSHGRKKDILKDEKVEEIRQKALKKLNGGESK